MTELVDTRLVDHAARLLIADRQFLADARRSVPRKEFTIVGAVLSACHDDAPRWATEVAVIEALKLIDGGGH